MKNLDRKRRQNDDDEDMEDFDPNDEQPGGLVGLIGSLSGVIELGCVRIRKKLIFSW